MLKLRLQRTGRKNDPSFRIVVVEGTEGPRTGNHIDLIGFYNAATKEKRIDGEKAKSWISKGAQPSDTVYNMLINEGVLSGKKRNALPKKTPTVKEVSTEEIAPAEIPQDKPAEEAPVSETPKEGAPAAESIVSEETKETPSEKPSETVPEA